MKIVFLLLFILVSSPVDFAKHASGTTNIQNWRTKIWVDTRDNERIKISDTCLLKYYKGDSYERPCNKTCDEFLQCKVCKKLRRFKLESKEECRIYHDLVANKDQTCSNMGWTCQDFPVRTSAAKQKGCREEFVLQEINQLLWIAVPTILTGFLVCGKSFTSMFVLGRICELETASGSLSNAITNITGFSVIYGLSMGMDGITPQAYDVKVSETAATHIYFTKVKLIPLFEKVKLIPLFEKVLTATDTGKSDDSDDSGRTISDFNCQKQLMLLLAKIPVGADDGSNDATIPSTRKRKDGIISNDSASNPVVDLANASHCPNEDSVDEGAQTEALDAARGIARDQSTILDSSTFDTHGFLVCGKSFTSTFVLGRIGELETAGGSLSNAITNITGFSVIYGLPMGMDGITPQTYGAMLILLTTTIPITILWLNAKPVLIFAGQDVKPIRIYLKAKEVTRPIIIGSVLALLTHVAINGLVLWFEFGIKGAALAVVVTDIVYLLALLVYMHTTYDISIRTFDFVECFAELTPILSLAIPSCWSACLEWWFHDLMIYLSGLLPKDTKANISAMKFCCKQPH
ncbi:protein DETOXIFICATION 49 [Artemisia annua]|uniref:Protein DETOXIFICATION n=1 Tax=Artemisia annua TaxID=35608 RepID=A0A2U1LW61_ARTAN|nr:protein DETOXIFICATION 49 [Artemisia annua]